MPLITVSNARLAYGTQLVLDGATVSIEPGEKVGLVGRNGQGKTTLMRVMLGSLEPDSGGVQVQRGARVGYLSQDPSFDPGDTVRDAAERAFVELHDLHVQLNHVFEEMATAEGDALERLLRKQSRLESEIESAGGYAIDHKIDATLHGLGFTDDQFTLPVTALSGGQKNRLGLAKLLLEEPDLLLLDEPTNHLDIDGRKWLEEFLAVEYPGAVVVVSHDRWLLDRVVDRIVAVEAGQIRTYPGNYHKYVELRRERQETVARVREKQLDRIRSEEAFIRKFKEGQRAKQARGRQTRLERFKRDHLVEKQLELSVMNLNLPRPSRSGDQVIVAEGISKRYARDAGENTGQVRLSDAEKPNLSRLSGELVLFEDLDLTVMRGDRIGIIGPNGVGKTTLVKCLLGELEPDTGRVRMGSRVSVGYYRQSHEHIDHSLTVWQYLQQVIVSLDGAARASEQQARDLAGAFLFSGPEQDKPLGDLSGGERSRAVLAGLVAGAHNLLVLDEPSNHLDIPSAERLEQALSPTGKGAFDGSLVLISHDRALLEKTCDQLLIFEGDGKVRQFAGKYSEWEEKKAGIEASRGQGIEASRPFAPGSAGRRRAGERGSRPNRRDARRVARPGSAGVPPAADNGQPSAEALSRLSLDKLEARIESRESRMREIDAMLIDPDVYADGARCKDLTAERARLLEELEPLEFEWARRADDGA